MKKQLLKKKGGILSGSRFSTLRRLTWVAFFTIATLAAAAQTRTLTGTVVDEKNNPVPGVGIILDGTSRGTASGADGTFTLTNMPASGNLQVQMIGYVSQVVPITNQTVYRIELVEDTQFLDEVVVVGYGVMRRSDVTGSMVSVGAAELQERPVTNAFQALQGKAAGVDITNSNRPGELGSIRIRGQRSISGGTSPLYVVDGIPLQGSTDISVINTYDIKSIDILKDASATAIYGSRGANGVVLVTTNRGEEGRFSINYNGSLSIEKIEDSADRFTSGEWIDFVRWANYYAGGDFPRADQATIDKDFLMFSSDQYAWANVLKGWSNGAAWEQARQNGQTGVDAGTWDGSRVATTDWAGMVTRTGITHNHQISASGGTDRMTSRASFGYLNQKGTSYGQELERYTVNIASVLKPKSWFELSATVNTTWSIQEYGQDGTGAGSSSGPGNIYASAVRMLPYAVPYDDEGNRILTPGGIDMLRNIVDEWDHSRNRRETFNAFASLTARVKLPIEGLSYEFRTGPSYRQRRNGIFVSPLSAVRQDPLNLVRLNNNRQFSWTLDNQINYVRTFGKHSINVTLLQSAEKIETVSDNINATNLPLESALWNNMGSIEKDYLSVGSDLVQRQMTSYMGRANYSYNDKYLATFTVRSDGSSVLAPGYKWGTFFSGSVAWRLEQEEFIKNISWIQQLKLRLGYGETGQQGGIDPYSSIAGISSSLYPYGTNIERFYYINLLRPNQRYADPTLGWETTRTFNAGVDFSILRSRISGAIDYYHSITSDLILNATLLYQTGYATTTGNLGKTQNSGFELTLNTVNVRAGDFTWESSLSGAYSKNKILELADGKVDDVANSRFIGESIRMFYAYKEAGVWREEDAAEMAKYNSATHPVTGEAKTAHSFQVGQTRIVDQDGDYVITQESDRVIIGHRDPTWTAGFRNTFSYKGIELGIMMYGRFGYWGNGGAPALGAVGAHRKVDYYNELNKNASFHRPSKTSDGHDDDPYASAQQYYKASFLNVQNISLGYVFPRSLVRKWGLENLRVYAQVHNPFAVYQSVKWKNMDVDSEIWSRNFVFGVNIGF